MRLIDADKLLKDLVELEESLWNEKPYIEDRRRLAIMVVFNKVKLLVKQRQTVDAEPVRHGKWLSREEGAVYPFWERYTCSVCGKHADDTDYCPHCGARMVKDDQTD